MQCVSDIDMVLARELRKSRAQTTPAATESVASAAVTDATSVPSIPEEVLPLPKKTRKHQPVKRKPPVAAAVTSTNGVTPEQRAPESAHLGPSAVEMDWEERQDFGTFDPSIDPILLGLSNDQ
jgi:hypothetical protein